MGGATILAATTIRLARAAGFSLPPACDPLLGPVREGGTLGRPSFLADHPDPQGAESEGSRRISWCTRDACVFPERGGSADDAGATHLRLGPQAQRTTRAQRNWSLPSRLSIAHPAKMLPAHRPDRHRPTTAHRGTTSLVVGRRKYVDGIRACPRLRFAGVPSACL